jgi:outer membrane lipoprotein-sorting protein
MRQMLVLLLAALPLCSVFSQQSKVLNGLIAKLNTVKDYTVDAYIVAEVPMIKIKKVNAKLYFKQKDKFKIDAKGIAVLPKQGFTDLNRFITNTSKYMAVESTGKMINGVNTTLVTLIPTEENGEVILAKLWIDPKKSLVLSSQVTTKSSGMMTVNYAYAEEAQYGLPSNMVFEIDVKKFKMPKSVAANIHQTDEKPTNDSKDKKGKITIQLSNYQVNKGLSDAVFKKQ